MLAPRFSPLDAADVAAVFTDFDGTLTTGGRLLPSTYAALGQLEDAGVPVVIVTGRPSGWGEAMARAWPVRAVITENGGVSFVPSRRGLRRVYAVDEAELPALRRRMFQVARRVCAAVPGARLSSDSRYTEVDLAIDWNEEARLGVRRARRIEALLRAAGYNAVRSSVHVNFWPDGFDKLSACRHVAALLFGARAGRRLDRFVYVGDALNDEPMFGGFTRSIGVANIVAVWDELQARPAFVTGADGGRGFEEIARAILARRGPRGVRRSARQVGRRL